MPSLPRRILLVDDSPEDRETWRQHLMGLVPGHYQFIERDSLEGALEACRTEQPDCILLDYHLPDGNGVDFVRDLEPLGGSLVFPTVMLTATGNEAVAVKAMKAGVQDYIVKHRLDPEKLHRALEGAIYKAETDRLLARQRAELEEAYRQAKEANARKDQFLAVLSHELRTPLTPVLAVVSTPDVCELSSDELREVFGLIRRNVEVEARLIDDLLDIARIIHGRLDLRIEDVVDVHQLVRHALETCRLAADAKGVTLTDTLDATRSTVRGDPTRIQQVAWNLLNNAVKFTPSGGHVRIETADGPEGWLHLTVADSGVGLAAAKLVTIFDAFDQGESQAARESGGLGLGLAICKALVEAHGGRISAESAGVGQGSIFRVELATVTGAPSEKAAPTEIRSGGLPSAPTPAARPILLVEDHADSARALTRILRRRGFDVTHASSVAEARELFGSRVFDAVISDLGLPDGNGADLIRSLREKRPVPSIVLSGFGDAEMLARSLEAGAQEHLLKPVTWPQLEAALKRLFPSAV